MVQRPPLIVKPTESAMTQRRGFVPRRTCTMDGHLGFALIQIVAFVFDSTATVSNRGAGIRSASSLETLRNPYCRRVLHDESNAEDLIFVPGGGGLFRSLAARWQVSVSSALENLHLAGVLLINENLEGSDLRGANLERAIFYYCDIGSAMLSSAVIEDAVFQHNYGTADMAHAVGRARATNSDPDVLKLRFEDA